MKRLFLFLLLSALLALAACADNSQNGNPPASVGDFEFQLIGGNYAVAGYNGTSSNVPIPAEYDGKKVVAIRAEAFRGNTVIKKLTIPNSVVDIADNAFLGCDELEEIIVDGENRVYKSIGGVLYIKDALTFLHCPKKISGAVTVPEGITAINKNMFSERADMTKITLPVSVTTIEEGAFNGCASLTEMTLPFIGKSRVAEGREQLFGYIFGTAVYDGGAATEQYYSASDIETYYIPSGIVKVAISDGATKIGDYAFYGCSSIESITLPASVNTIGKKAFYGCTGLTGINVDASNKSLKSIDGVLYTSNTLIACPAGKTGTVTIPGGITTIASFAFGSCSVTSVTVPADVDSIFHDAFDDCAGLTAINVAADNNDYKSVDGVLYNKAMTELIICPEGKTGAITVADGVERIEYSFSGCGKLTSIILPQSIKYMVRPFEGCVSLTSVTVNAAAPPDLYSHDVFSDAPGTLKIYVPASSVNTYKTDEDWSIYASKIQAIQ